jgi:hypothetical protein
MNFTIKHKLYFNVFLFFIFIFRFAQKIIHGYKTQDFNYLRIVFNAIIIVFLILNIIKYYKIEEEKTN